jgi:hypothetical protein
MVANKLKHIGEIHMESSLVMGVHAAILRLPFDEDFFEELNGCKDNESRNHRDKPRYESLFSERSFIATCRRMYHTISEAEAGNIYNTVMAECERREDKNCGLFSLICILAKIHLKMSGNDLYCNHQNFILWREAVHGIGQMPFICAFIADKDVKAGYERNSCSNFPLFLRTDDFRLRQILSKGTAENHFHLGGSSPAFLNSWVCLMNYPSHKNRAKEFKAISDQLNNVSPLMKGGIRKYVNIAAGIRVALWRLVNYYEVSDDKDDANYFKTHDFFHGFCDVEALIAREKAFLGDSLDYTCKTNESSEVYAGLAGENTFLYRVFYQIYSGNQVLLRYADYFYAYLAIFCLFRSELNQVNNAVGFGNFLKYQDRKTTFIEEHPKYLKSFEKMAFDSSLSSIGTQSVEMRIGSQNTAKDLKKKIENYIPHLVASYTKECKICKNYDKLHHCCKSRLCEHRPAKVFFVLSIPKKSDKFDKDNKFFSKYRHKNYVRTDVLPKINSLVELRKNNPEIAKHIYGIDACSTEIGCRPEVFAPAFRRARESIFRDGRTLKKMQELPTLHITYHAGEDFLDIADGLRAIDEAVRFFGMHSADRFGHALALGVFPKKHYKSKGGKIYLPRHDLLDNAAWVIMGLQRFNLHIPDVVSLLNQVFREQFIHIYQNPKDYRSDISVEQFYDAWKLRGDDPSYYIDLFDDNTKYKTNLQRMKAKRKYYSGDLQTNKEVRKIRENDVISRKLYHDYHYDNDVRRRGIEKVEWSVNARYTHAINLLQKEMQKYIAACGIGIECNPSSNYLIGTFKDYKKHPLFRFNNDGLCTQHSNDCAMLHTSINTDDQGIFDTDLENEYALIACALSRIVDDDGEKAYSPNTIYKYIDNVRKTGLEQSYKLLEHNLSGGISEYEE